MSGKSETVAIPVELRRQVHIRRILFATDLSSASEAALNYALAIGRRYESELYVAHVTRLSAHEQLPVEAAVAAPVLVRSSAEHEMANLLISGRLRGVSHHALVEQGELWEVLSVIIQKYDIDLIVVGTHGRTGVKRVVLGSVAEQIFRLSERPVLTVGPRATGKIPQEAKVRCVLYPTDFSPSSQRALPYALSLAQEHQAHLTLLYAVEDIGDVSWEGFTKVREIYTHRLEKLLPPGADLWCEPEFAVWFGAPVEGIIAVAKGQKADLIVMGVRGAAQFASHLPPGKAYRIVCEALCPVLTVRG